MKDAKVAKGTARTANVLARLTGSAISDAEIKDLTQRAIARRKSVRAEMKRLEKQRDELGKQLSALEEEEERMTAALALANADPENDENDIEDDDDL